MKKNNWTVEDMINVKGKIAVVTGANSGIGKETAKVLARKGAVVILAVRSIERGKEAMANIKKEFPTATVDVMELDLSSLESIKSFAKTFSKGHSHLNYLVNNAGIMVPPYSKTKDGFELQFGTNHLGHFALTGLLLPLLKKGKNSRVVNVSSMAHKRGNINFDDLAWESREYDAWQSYGDSKIANLYFTYELSRKLKDTDIKVVAAHPGWTMTNIQVNSLLFRLFNPFFAQKPKMGALPTLRATAGINVEEGHYYGPAGWQEIRGYPVKVPSNELSHDKKIAKKLWHVSEELTGIKY